MGITVQMYYNNSDNNVVNKSLTSGSSFDCEFKNDSSVFDPVIIVSTSANLSRYNYFTIPHFNRRYFVTDIKVLRNNIWQISGHVDVLSTYASEVLALKAVIKRQNYMYNTYLDDPNFKVQNNESVETLQFSGSALTKALNYVLVVAGD